MDALAGLLDGPRARDAFLLRSLMARPWSIRVQDLWGIDNGFRPDTLRTIDPKLLMRSPVPQPRPPVAQSMGARSR